MSNDGETWVASVHVGFGLHFEFHARQDITQYSGAACIHHCLLRVRDRDDARLLTESFESIGDSFSHLRELETVVLETGPDLETDAVRSLAEALRKISRVAVQHRTSDEAHKLALLAKNGSSRSASMGLLSPFWCLQEHVWLWDDWMSEEYLNNVSGEDWKGWDPSR